MRCAGPADESACKDIVFIRVERFLETVRCHHDRSRKCRKLFVLVLPCRSVVPVKMWILFQFRIRVCREHLSVCVYVDVFAFCLFEDGLKVLEVMSGYEDGLALFSAEGDLRWYGVSVFACVRCVKDLHSLQVDLTAFKSQRDPCIHCEVLVEHCAERFVYIFIYGVLPLAEDLSVIGVCCKALQAVKRG
ncbi:hypothetical protein BMS3Abin09_00915 [bacterium BMS3Abin09]|nr:hypothetical protein BMS3Abin09_00915 [bacterium BMS3Abin09]